MKNFAVFLAALVPAASHAQEPKTFVCSFTEYVSQETPKTKVDQPLALTFIATPSTSLMVGNNGSAEVISFFGEIAVTFIERLGSGATQTTTIDVMGNQNPYPAVHSRHTIAAGKMIPSQYYGTCEWQ
jgi:hypothetical protein